MAPKYYTGVKKDIIPSRDKMKWTDWRKMNYKFFQKFNYQNKKVVDLGAGKGHFRDLFRGSEYTAVDFYPYEGIDIVADLTKPLPLESENYDYVILSNVLEHIPDPQALMKECHRILKKGGQVLITVPFFIKLHQQPYDFFRYTEYALQNLLFDFQGVKIEKMGTISDIYRGVLDNLFGLKSRFFRPVYYLIRLLTSFKADHKNYVQGYGVIAKKP